MTLKRNVVANYISQGWRAAIGVAFVPLYIKYLGIEAYGLIGIFTILQASLSLLDMGMKPALGREMARFTAGAHDAQSIRDLLRSIEIIGIFTGIVIVLLTWFSARWFASDWITAKNLTTGVVSRAFTAMGIVIALRFVESIYASSIVGLQSQVLESIVSSTMATARALGAVALLAWISPSIEVFFLWQGLISLITVPVLASIVYRHLPVAPRPVRFSWTAVIGVWRFAAGVTAITLLALLLTQMDKILLSRLLPLKVFAYYALAGVLTNVLYVLTIPISAAFYPQFTELVTLNNSEALKLAYHQATQLTTVIVGGAAIMLIVFADMIVHAWTSSGSLTAEVAPLLRLLALGTLLNALMVVPYQMQLAHGWTALTIKVNVVAVALLVPAIFVSVPRYGAIGAAWIWVTLNVGYLVVDIYFMHRRLLKSEKWRWYGCDVLTPLIAASVTALFCRYAMPQEIGKKVVEVGVLAVASTGVVFTAAMFCPLVRGQLVRRLQAGAKYLQVRFTHFS